MVHYRIFAVLVVVVFVDLPGVVGRIADNDEDGGFLLALYPLEFSLGKDEGAVLASASSKVSTRQMPSKGS